MAFKEAPCAGPVIGSVWLCITSYLGTNVAIESGSLGIWTNLEFAA